jgi:thiamine biosynthesis lipoprotein
LIHGGTSTVEAIGHPPDAETWRIAVADPLASPARPPARFDDPAPGDPNLLATVELKDEAMSVSGIHGKFFEAAGRTFGHILDPRTGEPAKGAILAVVILPSATETDALSTALLILGPEGHQKLSSLRPGMRSLVAAQAEGKLQVKAQGITLT